MASAVTGTLGSVRSFINRQPHVAKAGLTSSAIMMLGDIIAQRVTTPPNQAHRWDARRTARFGVVGLTFHGPYFFTGMRKVDQWFGPAKTFTNAIKKAGTSQALLFPPFLPLLFGYIGLLEGKSPEQCVQKMKDNIPQAFVFGMFFWPAANVINFRFINPHQRVLYVSCAGLIWNTYISWINAHKLTAVKSQ